MYEVKSRFQRNGIVTILSCVKVEEEITRKTIRISNRQFDIYYDYFDTLEEVIQFKKKFRNLIDLTR